MRKAIVVGIAVVMLLVSTGCAAMGAFGDSVSRAFNGVPAVMTTYTQSGQKIDHVEGTSFRVTRNEEFDTTSTNSDGSSSDKKDSQVLLISIGDSHISHVGSSLIIAQTGLIDVTANSAATVQLQNSQPGTPILNDFIEKHRNLWQGKSKTIMLRSQDGTPIAVYAGDAVEAFATDVPKSTAFRVDGKYLFAYRVDYTVYSNDLL